MSWLREHWLPLALFGLYTMLLVWHGIEGKRKTHGRSDYYVGGRTMGGAAIGLSFFATYSSTNSFVGFSGQAYSYGASWLLLVIAVVVFSLVAWLWVAPRLRQFTARVDSVTLADYIGFRFDSTGARMLAAVIVLFASFLYMTAVFKGIGNLLSVFLDMSYSVAIIIVFFVVVMYTAAGGFISVVRTDVVQGVIMVFAAVLLFAGVVSAAGGLGVINELKEQANTASLFRWDTAMPFPVLLGVIVAGTLKFIVEPRQLSRFYALSSRREVFKGVWVSTLTFLFVYALLLPIGLYAHRVLGSGLDDTDLVVPMLLDSGAFFPFVGAFLLVAMVAAAMSSLDSVLLVMASTCERDLVGLIWPQSEHKAVRLTRAYVGLFALVTALIALGQPAGIVTLTAFSGSLFAACFFPAIVFGLHWRRGNGAAVIASYILGVGTLLLWPRLPLGENIHQVFPALALSTLAYAIVSAMKAPIDSRAIIELFQSGAAE